ncbi:MAG TPA: fibronectin type III domain-containing protein [Bacteroidia bacterium]|jgi:fibronectin type 3 domain-containing protein|nr:fibronectin type III domain-containing protein [Bacteroidia bacterium]
MKTKFYLIAVLLLQVFAINVHAQQSIKAKTFVKEKSVYIRYVASDYNAFKQCLADGFSIQRISWDSPGLPDANSFKNSTAIPVKCLNKENAQWDSLAKKIETAGFLYNLMFQPMGNGKKDPNFAYGLAMLSCDLSVDVATAAGLFYTDRNLPAGKYAYLIQPRNAKIGKIIKPAIVLVNSGVDDRLDKIDSVQLKTRRKEISLRWDVKNLRDDYSGYFIERSEDGAAFSVVNKTPVIFSQSQHEKNKTHIYYSDTITTYGKTYAYRIRGLGFFGVYGDYSKTVKIKLIKPLDAFPSAENPVLVGDTTLEVHWRMPTGFDLNELIGFDVLRAETAAGNYAKINKNKLPKETKTFLDKEPKSTNYYKVMALGVSGDSAFSFAMMGLVPDKTPPAIPTGLNGKIDSAGNVRLSWKPNKDKDLKGYRIFRNNAMNEELVEVTKEILTDTIFNDKVSLETLSEDVFYSITAVDQVFNNSPFAKAVKLKRPDKIKPVEAQFLQLTHNDSCILVNWIPSTSKDAEKYELWKNKKGEAPQKIKEWKATDSLHQYKDAQLEYGTYYQYSIKVIDDDKNFSSSTSGMHYFDSRIRKPVSKIKYKVNLEQRSITLNWEYPENDLYSFVVYKAKVGDPLKIVKTLKPGQFLFEDKELYIGNKYVYKIKAIYNSGAESKMSDEIKIEF